MMEVKQNTPVPLMDYTKNNNSNSPDSDAILEDTLASKFCARKSSRDSILNGTAPLESIEHDLEDELDFPDAVDEPISSDLEDALLAGDEPLEALNTKDESCSKENDKSDNSTDPGDDLDKLLSKISDLVDDSEVVTEAEDIIKTINIEEVEEKDQNGEYEKTDLHLSTEEIQSADEDKPVNISSSDDDLIMIETGEFNREEKEQEIEKETLTGKIETGKIENHIKKTDYINKELIKKNEKAAHIETEITEESSKNENDLQEDHENEKTKLSRTHDIKASVDLHSEPNINENKNNEKRKNEEITEKCADELSKVEKKNDETSDTVKITEKVKSDEETENKVEVMNNDNLEDGEILDDDDDKIILENKKTKKNVEEPTLISDDDEEDTVVVQTSTNKLNGKPIKEVDEIVCLDDEDDEDITETESKVETESKTNIAEEDNQIEKTLKPEDIETPLIESKVTDLTSDNTDNACDGVVGTKTVDIVVAKTTQIDADTRSEGSSSSNLLLKGTSPKETGLPPPDIVEDDIEAEVEAEAETDDADETAIVENKTAKPIENENKDAEEVEVPPTKRLRLSVDSDSNSEAKKKEDTKVIIETKVCVNNIEKSVNIKESLPESIGIEKDKPVDLENIKQTTSTKRSFEEINKDNLKTVAEPKHSTEIAVKKLKTDNEVTSTVEEKTVKSSELKKLLKPEQTEELLEVQSARHTVVPSNMPIPLYPPPKLLENTKPLRLDFLERFRKTFDQMSKNDLEELVLQKIVEALVHENEFAELRSIIEKQEKVIALHRSKLAQLVKQYRDLDMVHARVAKDMREKNSQYQMPVRITRAVGLQVSTLSSRKDSLGCMNAPSSTITNQPSTSTVLRSPQGKSAVQQPSLASPQRNNMPSTAVNNFMNSSVTTSNTQTPTNVRRGCVQKVTAQRPVNGNMTTSNPPMSSVPSNHLRSLQAKPSTYTAAEFSKQNTPRGSNKSSTSSSLRMRNSGGNSPSLQNQQIKSPHQMNNRQQSGPGGINTVKINNAVQNKTEQQSSYRRSETLPSSGVQNSTSKTSHFMEQYQNSLNSAMPSVSITPAKPKEKSVIDLTDEDEISVSSTPPAMKPRTRTGPQSQMNNSNNLSRQGVPPLTRMPNSQANARPHITPKQLSSMQAQRTTITAQAGTATPIGMNVARLSKNNVPPPLPPLPPTPSYPYNPTWKLLPPKPTIRISNLDNGIVISWTMEEVMDRHAEITTYQIYAYYDSWRHVGDVKAMLLPMAVTLTQFQEDQRYYFAVRAMDAHQRYGPFSAPKTWS